MGDALYTPAGAVCMDGQGQEDCLGVRIPIIAQWDDMVAQEYTACQADWAQRTGAENPVVERMLEYLTKMRSQSGAKPDGSKAPIWDSPPLRTSDPQPELPPDARGGTAATAVDDGKKDQEEDKEAEEEKDEEDKAAADKDEKSEEEKNEDEEEKDKEEK